MFSEFDFYTKFEVIGTAYMASFSENEQHRRQYWLTQFSAVGLGTR